MKAFVYTDYKDNIFDYKKNINPICIVVAIIFAVDITEADKKFKTKTGKDVMKCPTIGCAPMDLGDFALFVAEKLNAKELAADKYKKEIKKLHYEIYGLENPWLKKAPDYSI